MLCGIGLTGMVIGLEAGTRIYLCNLELSGLYLLLAALSGVRREVDLRPLRRRTCPRQVIRTIKATAMPSRILAIANFFFPDQAGGQARIAYELAWAYVALGHEVWLLCQATDESAPPYRLEEGIHILRYFVKRSSGIDFTRHIKHISAVTETLDKFFPGYPDVVHGHDLLPYVAALEQYHGRSRFCYTIHSPAIEELNIAWKPRTRWHCQTLARSSCN